MSVHLPWLVARLEALGGALAIATLGSLDEVLARAPVVVNCAGLGAREFAGDDALLAVRGQILHVEQTGVDEWLLDQTDPRAPAVRTSRASATYVLGGTAQEGDEDVAVDPTTAAAIRARCEAAVPPRCGGARLLREAVGLRPARPAVRLETEARAAGSTVSLHCYGQRRRRRDARVGVRGGRSPRWCARTLG